MRLELLRCHCLLLDLSKIRTSFKCNSTEVIERTNLLTVFNEFFSHYFWRNDKLLINDRQCQTSAIGHAEGEEPVHDQSDVLRPSESLHWTFLAGSHPEGPLHPLPELFKLTSDKSKIRNSLVASVLFQSL